jgi:hypothetical protein
MAYTDGQRLGGWTPTVYTCQLRDCGKNLSKNNKSILAHLYHRIFGIFMINARFSLKITSNSPQGQVLNYKVKLQYILS